jgi:hypothetical protein
MLQLFGILFAKVVRTATTKSFDLNRFQVLDETVTQQSTFSIKVFRHAIPRDLLASSNLFRFTTLQITVLPIWNGTADKTSLVVS